MFALFLQDINRQKKRFILTAMAIIWGTISMVLFLAFGEGLQREFVRGTRGLGVGIVITGGGSTGKAYKGLGTGRPIHLTMEDMELLKTRIPEINRISGEFQTWDKVYEYNGKQTTTRVTGVYPDFKEMRTNFAQVGGRFINEIDITERRRVVYLGNKLKENLFDKENAVGKMVSINNIPFLVVGVMEPKKQMSMYSGPDDQQGVIPATTYRSLYGDLYFRRIIFQPFDVHRVEEVKTRVRQVLASRYRFDYTDTRALWMWDVAEQERIMNNVMLGLKIFLGVIGGMTLIIAGGGVANMMYVVVRRRTREIGIKMALGAKKRNILVPFLTEALMIMFSGGIVGIPLSIFLIDLYDRILPKQEGFLGEALDILNPVVSIDIAVGTVLILGTLGLLAGVFPARRAASINPTEALRYE